MTRIDLVDGGAAEEAMVARLCRVGSQQAFQAGLVAVEETLESIPPHELVERPVPMRWILGMGFAMGALWARENPERRIVVWVEVDET
jgi:hypothetical protein